jgi:hypothetical protein
MHEYAAKTEIGDKWNIRRKNPPLCTTSPTWTGPGSNKRLRIGTPTKDRIEWNIIGISMSDLMFQSPELQFVSYFVLASFVNEISYLIFKKQPTNAH